MPSVKRTPSAPNLVSNVPKHLSAPSIVKPIALPALRGLSLRVPGFQRSRSAPPTPRDPPGALEKEKGANDGTSHPPAVPEGVVAPEAIPVCGSVSLASAHVGAKEKPAQVIVTDESAGHPPAPVAAPTPAHASVHAKFVYPTPTSAVVIPPESVIAATSIGRARSSHGHGVAPGGVPVIPVPPTLNLGFGPPSRSASPAPSLEQAIRVERKRRAASASGNQTAVKGGWFKSSPLNSGERHGVIVAERVKRGMQGDGTVRDPSGDPQAVGVGADVSLKDAAQAGPELLLDQYQAHDHAGTSEPGHAGLGDVRKPDEQDKAGPDKRE